ncbi:hemoblobin-interacting domain-containing protein [Paenibacillus sp. FA6]|uniref:hemoblobin-interacting domain-containing protein n=1 Tax=Paenibacillus sp. FA6 TaxID=3413029 RepID=UPI003F65C9A8
MHTTSVKTVLNRLANTMLRRVSISLLAALMVVSSFSFSSMASADATTSGEWVPTYLGSETGGGSSLYMYFDEDMALNNTTTVSDATYLKSQLTIAKDGVNFVALPVQSEVELYGNEIDLNYDFDVQIVQGPNTHIKIAAGALKDVDGNLNSELILDVAPPVIQSAAISNFNHDVTITFQEEVYDNQISNSVSNLKNYIKILRSGADSATNNLTANDTVSIESGKLVIHYAQALTGANNQIIIEGYALKDSYGNVNWNRSTTSLIRADADVVDPSPADTTAPKFVKAYIANSNHDIVLEFDEAVFNNKATLDSLKSTIYYQYYTNGQWFYNAPSDLTFTFSGNALIIHSLQPLNGQYYLQFQPYSFKDASGNTHTGAVNMNWIYSRQSLDLYTPYITHNGSWLNLPFSYNPVDATQDSEGVSHLKEKISIWDGTNFSSLTENDVVSIQEDKLVIIFHEAKTSNSVRIKVEADSLSDDHNNVRNTEIDSTIGYNTPEITGYLFSNAPSELTFEDNGLWRNKVSNITIYDNNAGTTRILLPLTEYTITAGKLTINPGVFQKGVRYSIYINAEGYSSKYLYNRATESSEVFYMTAPVITTNNGLTAKINVFNAFLYNYGSYNSTGTQSVIFELMKGNTPVSIVEANLKVGTGTYSASFNVTDPTNKEYTVKAFLVNKFNNDFTSVGTNMATQATQTEMDLMLNNEYGNTNGNDD